MLQVSSDYGYALLSGVSLTIVYMMHSLFVVGSARSRVFSKEFMNKNFGELHKQTFGNQVGDAGYPDFGNGYYSKKLQYKDWVQFNNAQRTQYNILEWLPIVLFFIVMGGLGYPIETTVAGFVYSCSRFIYTIGYLSSKGAKGRIAGSAISFLAMFAMIVLSIMSIVKIYN